MRVVLDANVLVSALLSPGTCRKIVAALEEDKFTLVLSPALLEDFLRALEKPKLKRLIPSNLFEELISLIHMKAVIVEPRARIKACRDPADDAVLECAVAGRAHVVTGDKDLLSMRSFKSFFILTPGTFSRRLKIG